MSVSDPKSPTESRTSGVAIDQFKVVVVGDGMVGKTSLLMSFAHNEFPTGYVPTILETYAKLVNVDGKQATLHLWDTAGQESFDHLRGLAYANTNIFLLTFDISNTSSFDNVEDRWFKELQKACPEVPTILVGTHLDLREQDDPTSKFVTFADGMKLAQRLELKNYLECSAVSRKGLDDVFVEATRVCRGATSKRRTSILKRLIAKRSSEDRKSMNSPDTKKNADKSNCVII